MATKQENELATAITGNQVIRILQIDDDQSILEVSKLILQDVDGQFEVDSVTSPDQAFKKLSERSFDVIVCDYEMPIKNGLEFLQELKKRNILTPFILFTGKGREEVAIKALNLGAAGYVDKHGNPETVYGELAHLINNIVALRRAKDEHKRAESLRSILLDNVPCTAMILEKHTRKIIDSNRIARDKGAIAGKTCYTTCGEQNVPCEFCLAPKLWETNQPQSLEVKSKGRYYRGIWVPYSENLYIHYIFDITDRMLAEENLRKSHERERKLADLVKNASVAVAVGYPDGRIGLVNAAFQTLTGYNEEELQKISWNKILTPLEYFQTEKELMAKAASSKKAITYRKEYIRKDGSRVPIELVTHPFFDEKGKLEFMAAFITDITERKKTEVALMESEEKFRKAFEISPDPCYIATLEKGIIIDVNKSYEKMWGYSRSECIGKSSLELGLYANGRPDRERMLKEIQANGYFKNLEFLGKRKNGETFPLLFSGTIFEINNEKYTYGTLRDISLEKQNENDLELKYETLEQVAESIDSGLAIIGKDYRIVWANTRLRKIVGFSNKKCHELFTNSKNVCPNCGVRKIFENNANSDVRQFETVNSKGETVCIELRATPLRNKNGDVVAAIELAIPVTERTKAEKALKDSLKFNEKILKSTPTLIYIYDIEKNQNVYTNQELTDYLGYSTEQVQAMGSMLFANILHPDDAAAVVAHHAQFRSCPDNALYEIEYRMRHSNGQWRWLRSCDILFSRNAEGTGKQILGSCEDITEKKAAKEELYKKNLQLKLLNEKIQVMDSLTRHDVLNKLASARNYAYLMKKKLTDPNLLEFLDKMVIQLEQSEKIFAASRIYEKIGSEIPQEVDVGESFEKALKLTTLGNIKSTNGCRGLKVTADSMLSQLFYNLIDNSLKHGKNVNEITLNFTRDKAGNLKICYEDNGVGVPTMNKKIIFNGYTTGGTGLGLRLVTKMIEAYGWAIEENGEPGKGARFELTEKLTMNKS